VADIDRGAVVAHYKLIIDQARQGLRELSSEAKKSGQDQAQAFTGARRAYRDMLAAVQQVTQAIREEGAATRQTLAGQAAAERTSAQATVAAETAKREAIERTTRAARDQANATATRAGVGAYRAQLVGDDRTLQEGHAKLEALRQRRGQVMQEVYAQERFINKNPNMSSAMRAEITEQQELTRAKLAAIDAEEKAIQSGMEAARVSRTKTAALLQEVAANQQATSKRYQQLRGLTGEGLQSEYDRLQALSGRIRQRMLVTPPDSAAFRTLEGRLDGVQRRAQLVQNAARSMGVALEDGARRPQAALSETERRLEALRNQANRVGLNLGSPEDIIRQRAELYRNSINTASNYLLGAGAAGVGAAFGLNQMGAGREAREISFGALAGGGQAMGAQVLEQVDALAVKVGSDLNGARNAAQAFLNADVSQGELPKYLHAVAGAAEAAGRGQAGYEQITRGLSQILMKGTVSAEEMTQQLGEIIPAWQILAEQMGTDIAGAKKMVDEGAISSQQAVDALIAGMEGRYGNLADTLNRLETQTSTLNELKLAGEEMGQALGPTFDAITEGVRSFARWLNNLDDGQKAFLGKAVLWGSVGAIAIGVIGKIVTGISALKTAYLVLTAAKVADTTATGANTTATELNAIAQAAAAREVNTLGLAFKGAAGAAAAIAAGAIITGYFLEVAKGTNAAVDAANAEAKALDAAATKRQRLIDSLQREVDLYRQMQTTMGASTEKTEQLAGSKERIQANIKEITDLLGIQAPAWDGTTAALDEFIRKAREAANDGNAQETVTKSKQEYLALQEELVKSVAAGAGPLMRPTAESAALSSFREKLNKSPALATQDPEKVLGQWMTLDKAGAEKVFSKGAPPGVKIKFTEEQWAEVLRLREELRASFLQLQTAQDIAAGKLPAPGTTSPATAPDSAGKMGVSAQAALAQLKATQGAEEAGVNKVRRAIDLKFQQEWGQKRLLAGIIGGQYAKEIAAQEALKQAELDRDRAKSDAWDKYHRQLELLDAEEEKKKEADRDPAALQAAKDLAKTQMEDALDAAGAAFESKKLTVDLELRQATYDRMKERIQNAYENTILGPRFKQMYAAAFEGVRGQMNQLAYFSAGPSPNASAPIVPLPAGAALATAGGGSLNGKIQIVLTVEDNPEALGRITAIARDAGADVLTGGARGTRR
jgi:tape measure domain-containing protein